MALLRFLKTFLCVANVPIQMPLLCVLDGSCAGLKLLFCVSQMYLYRGLFCVFYMALLRAWKRARLHVLDKKSLCVCIRGLFGVSDTALLCVLNGSSACLKWLFYASWSALLRVLNGSFVCLTWLYCASYMAVLCHMNGSFVCLRRLFWVSQTALLSVSDGSFVCPRWHFWVS